MKRRWLVLAAVTIVTIVIAPSACVRVRTDASASADAERPPFVGSIREIRSSYIVVDEEAASARRGEIFLPTSTEITTRSGMLVPIANLRLRMRVTVWLRPPVNEASGTVTATADRIVVDY